jgi:hypothetical protein
MTLYINRASCATNPVEKMACPHVSCDVICIASGDSLNQTHMVNGVVAAFISSTADCRGGPQIGDAQAAWRDVKFITADMRNPNARRALRSRLSRSSQEARIAG